MSHDPKWIRPFLIVLFAFPLLFLGIKVVLSIQPIPLTQTPTLIPSPGIYPYVSPKVLIDFSLPDTKGNLLSLTDLRGKFTLLFFGYSHCTDICPITLTNWKRVKNILGVEAKQINFLFISVDGVRDTPAALKEYLSHFDSGFLGMSGDDSTLAKIGPDYGLSYEIHTEEGANYSVDHTTNSYLINQQGKMITVFSYDADPQNVATIIGDYLK